MENIKNRFWLVLFCGFTAFGGGMGASVAQTAGQQLPYLSESDAPLSYSVSVFGTLGYSITDQPYRYIRADEHGAFRNLSRIGLQTDVQLSPQWSATVQGELAPSIYKDNRYHPHLSWAFLTFRPDNNWVLRAGKLRIPLMMNAENMPAAITYVQTNLPVEIYATSQAYDTVGFNLGYTWNLQQGRQAMTWEGYAGYTASYLRIFYRGGVRGFVPENTAVYMPYDTPLYGTSLLWQDFENDRQVRAKFFYAPIKLRDGRTWAKEPSRFVEYDSGKYAYLPVSGYDNVARQKIIFATLGVNWHLGNEFYWVGESVFRRSLNTQNGVDSFSLYFLLHKRFGRWIPYVSVAGILPSRKVRNYLKEMNAPTGSVLLDKMNMSSADNLLAMEQWSAALGTAYDIDSHQRLKLEWLYTKVENASFMVTARADQPFQHKGINMLSLSYNFMLDF